MRLLAPLAALLVAGCLSAPAPLPDAPAASPAALAHAEGDACTQLHLLFPSPAEPFRTFVPEGFELATSDPAGATVTVIVEVTDCPLSTLDPLTTPAAQERVGEMWVELPVTPPEGLAGDVGAHTVPVVGFVDGDALLERYAAWGLAAKPATLALAPTGGGTRVDVVAQDESYTILVGLARGGSPWEAGEHARWVPADGGASGRVLRLTLETTSLGAGTALLTHAGAGGAPPAADGVAHGIGPVLVHSMQEASP